MKSHRHALKLSRHLLVFVLLGVHVARAAPAPLDAKQIAKQVARCAQAGEDGSDPMAPIGAITRADAVGKRASAEVVQVTGKKARGYVFFASDGSCAVIPVVGKPAAYAKGDFGGGATVAYVLRAPSCNHMGCPTAITLKGAATTTDAALDALLLPLQCEQGADLGKLGVFPGHDSLRLACFSSGGADVSRDDLLIEAVDGKLTVVAEVAAGTAWVQIGDDGMPKANCTARPPGGIAVVARGARPTIDVTAVATAEEAAAAKVELETAGCEQTIATHRQVYDASAHHFVASGAAKVARARNLCACKK